MNRQTGFTLIELITVIVILGALAVIALPKYIDLQDEAEQAATEGVAGSLAAASATNMAAALAGDSAAVSVDNCDDVSSLLSSGGLPSDYTVTASGLTINVGGDCALTNSNVSPAVSVTFTGYGA